MKLVWLTPLLFVMATLGNTQPEEYELTVFNRSRNNMDTYNIITLRCIDTETGSIDRGAVFFRNNERIVLPRSTPVMQGVLFRITRELEGDYTCGRDGFNTVQSPPVRIVALPDNTIIPQPMVAFGNDGGVAILKCAKPPGALIQQYYVTWRNATNTSMIFYQLRAPHLRPSSPGPFRLSDRYNLNNDTFSLIISDVEPEDAETPYQCVLGVEDPAPNRNSFPYVYQQTERTDIHLSVFKAPEFQTLPRPRTISTSSATSINATFTCSVLSSPLPSHIAWRHRGTTRDQDSEYDIDTSPSRTEEGGQLTESRFTIMDLSGLDSGSVTCVASYFTEQLVLVSRVEHEVTLSVLDFPQELNVIPIGTGGFILQVTLKEPILEQIYLRTEFVDTKNQSNRQERISPMGFFNASIINHVIFAERVPFFPEFLVRVGLLIGGLEGPLYDKDNTEYVRDPRPSTTMIVTWVILAFVILLLFLIITAIITFLVLIRRNKTVEPIMKNVIGPVLNQEIRSICNNCCSRNKTDGESEAASFSTAASTKYVEGIRAAIKYGEKNYGIKKPLTDYLWELRGHGDDDGAGGGEGDIPMNRLDGGEEVGGDMVEGERPRIVPN